MERAKPRIEPLGDQHDRAAFSCGIDALDRYFRVQAGQDSRKRIASCFVLVAADGSAAGYYTLSATGIALVDLPPDLARKLPRYPLVPATLMGRLAVDHRQRGRGFGELLLFDAFSRTLRSEIASYAFVVDAKDDAARAFYEKYGFKRLPSADRRLFLPLAEIARAFV
ncbi:MAG TPA: GNAT family N-acetyltransferase [Xanthobacteraceae bacterium]|nr:GNAT family N-acetyltransferase [Xanthobacteraceae bacterium]